MYKLLVMAINSCRYNKLTIEADGGERDIIASGMGHRWAPSRHNRKKGCWLLVKVPIYLELFPINIELCAYILSHFEHFTLLELLLTVPLAT